MFDGLREKLSSFESDVEERAEEADATDESGEEAEATDATQQAEGAEAAAGADGAEQDDKPGSSGAGSPGTETPASDDGGGTSRGLAERAKLFATGRKIITEEELDEPLEDLEFALLQGDVEMSVASEIVDRLREELAGESVAQVKSGQRVVREAIGDALYDVISVGQFDFDARIDDLDDPVTIIFTGVNGVGKTTTIAKMARYLQETGHSVVLANGDTYRAGANEQLGEHADRLGKKLISHEQGGDPAAVIYDAVEYAKANDVDVVLGDTAGRLHTSTDLMAQLEKIDRVVDPDLTLFVDEAVAGQDATERARQFDEAAEIDGTILAKADADAQGGAAISIAHVTGKPILFLGTGQGYDDLERFDPQVIVDSLVGEA